MAAEFLAVADQRHLRALVTITEGIDRIGGLAEGLPVTDAARIIYFHFRNSQFALATGTFGWGVDRGTRWLLERVEAAILKP
ncbi:hypothetical protein ACQEVM_17525 [Streptomyces sp. CA-243310]|uniref:hypothetical protein n=1 Tax=Streptomyces sp. CA-243310 TaxID=3240056 RepID=UPI003D8D49DA